MADPKAEGSGEESDSGSGSYNSDDESEECKPKGLGLKICVPKNFTHVSAEDIKTSVEKGGQDFVIFDLREKDFEGGSIPGSIRTAFTDLESTVGDLVTKYKDQRVVFVCTYGKLRSPTAALSYLNYLTKVDPNAPTTNVNCLSGGLQAYVSKYHANPALVKDYDEKMWTLPEFVHVVDTECYSARAK